MKQKEILFVSLRILNFKCLVSLRVFWAKGENFKPSRSHLRLYVKKLRNIVSF